VSFQLSFEMPPNSARLQLGSNNKPDETQELSVHGNNKMIQQLRVEVRIKALDFLQMLKFFLLFTKAFKCISDSQLLSELRFNANP